METTLSKLELQMFKAIAGENHEESRKRAYSLGAECQLTFLHNERKAKAVAKKVEEMLKNAFVNGRNHARTGKSSDTHNEFMMKVG